MNNLTSSAALVLALVFKYQFTFCEYATLPFLIKISFVQKGKQFAEFVFKQQHFHPRRVCVPFFTSCEAMKFAETGHRRKECSNVSVRLLMVLHALRLECEKSMELTASSHRSWLFWSSYETWDETVLSESVLTVSRRKERQGVWHSLSQHGT